jgi:glycosyltransferase involved in cell wall biosynthesis
LPARGINQYTVPVKDEELRAAEAHIARLEEEVLRLKDVKHDLQVLQEEHRRLRRSAAGRMAKILSAPFRLFGQRQRTDAAEQDEYGRWFARQRVSAEEAAKLREQSRTFSYQPLISILTPTFNPNDEFLTAAVESVMAQAYENWELILVDDGSSDSRARALLKKLGQRDARIQIGVQEHGGISSALNTGLARARGDWIALFDHDDLLEPDALFRAIELLQNDREADVIYSDEDKIVDGKLATPLLKPDWSPDLFRTHDYLGHFVVMRRDLARAGFRSEFDGAQDYDLLLRVSEKTDRIRHLARVVYHWRRTSESTAHNIRRKPGALEAGRRAIEEHLVRRQENARVTIDWETHLYRVRREICPEKISIIINGAADRHAERIRARTNFLNFEIVANLKEATGEYVLFLDSDLEPLNENWLSAMGEQLSNPKIGAVGARIVSSDDTIESAGLILLPNGSAGSAFAGYSRNFRGANRQLQAVRNYSAVSASCLLTRREFFLKTASGNTGFLDFARGNDRLYVGTKFCLNLREHGLRTVSIPYAEVRRTSTRKNARATCLDLQKRWPEMFRRDPCYNPNLSSERTDFSLGT